MLGINPDPVTIKQVEVEIVDRAWAEGWAAPRPPAAALTGKKVAVIGSGPAGLAAAQQLTRAGHAVTVYERADAPGGLLRYGIPEFKMEKRHLDRRLAQMRAEGTEFVCGVNAGMDVPAAALRAGHDAIVLAGGATVPRGLPVPGPGLDGIHQAMDYLPLANRAATSSILNGGAGTGPGPRGLPAARTRPPVPAGRASSGPVISGPASSGPASGEPGRQRRRPAASRPSAPAGGMS